jgi:integrase
LWRIEMRGRGEGTIKQRQDGRFEVRLSIEGERRSFYAATRAEALRKLRELQRATDAGQRVVATADTAEAFLANWLTAKRSLRENVWEDYDRTLRNHFMPHLGDVKLTKLSHEMVQALYGALEDSGVGAPTINKLHRILHVAFKQAVMWRRMSTNITDLVEPPRVSKRPPRVFNESEIHRFLEAVRGTEFETVFVLAVTTGMRQSEILGLRWKDVDLATSYVSLLQQCYRGRTTELKTVAARRRLPLPPIALESLARRKAARALRVLDPEADHVFEGVASWMLREPFLRVLRKNKLPKLKFHDLRHTYATLLIHKGNTAPEVAKLMGHSSPVVTMREYAHAFPSTGEAAVQMINELFGGPNG